MEREIWIRKASGKGEAGIGVVSKGKVAAEDSTAGSEFWRGRRWKRGRRWRGGRNHQGRKESALAGLKETAGGKLDGGRKKGETAAGGREGQKGRKEAVKEAVKAANAEGKGEGRLGETEVGASGTSGRAGKERGGGGEEAEEMVAEQDGRKAAPLEVLSDDGRQLLRESNKAAPRRHQRTCSNAGTGSIIGREISRSNSRSGGESGGRKGRREGATARDSKWDRGGAAEGRDGRRWGLIGRRDGKERERGRRDWKRGGRGGSEYEGGIRGREDGRWYRGDGIEEGRWRRERWGGSRRREILDCGRLIFQAGDKLRREASVATGGTVAGSNANADAEPRIMSELLLALRRGALGALDPRDKGLAKELSADGASAVTTQGGDGRARRKEEGIEAGKIVATAGDWSASLVVVRLGQQGGGVGFGGFGFGENGLGLGDGGERGVTRESRRRARRRGRGRSWRRGLSRLLSDVTRLSGRLSGEVELGSSRSRGDDGVVQIAAEVSKGLNLSDQSAKLAILLNNAVDNARDLIVDGLLDPGVGLSVLNLRKHAHASCARRRHVLAGGGADAVHEVHETIARLEASLVVKGDLCRSLVGRQQLTDQMIEDMGDEVLRVGGGGVVWGDLRKGSRRLTEAHGDARGAGGMGKRINQEAVNVAIDSLGGSHTILHIEEGGSHVDEALGEAGVAVGNLAGRLRHRRKKPDKLATRSLLVGTSLDCPDAFGSDGEGGGEGRKGSGEGLIRRSVRVNVGIPRGLRVGVEGAGSGSTDGRRHRTRHRRARRARSRRDERGRGRQDRSGGRRNRRRRCRRRRGRRRSRGRGTGTGGGRGGERGVRGRGAPSRAGGGEAGNAKSTRGTRSGGRARVGGGNARGKTRGGASRSSGSASERRGSCGHADGSGGGGSRGERGGGFLVSLALGHGASQQVGQIRVLVGNGHVAAAQSVGLIGDLLHVILHRD